jgi:hypothetical protein
MIQSIFVVLGLVYFLDALFDKWGVYEMIAQYGSKAKRKFIYDLCFCRFCQLFHIGSFITIVYGVFSAFSFDLVIVPFVVSGLTRLIEKK